MSYRCRELLRDCLSSLDGQRSHLSATVYVVDNASGDGTVEMVRDGFSWVELIPSSSNLGFSRANNLAIRQGRSTYVLALNPDTRMPAGVVERLVALMDANPKIGISGCRLQLEDGSFDHAARRSFPTPLSALGHFTGLGRRVGAPRRLSAYRAPDVDAGPVDAVNGAFMLMRRTMLEEIGLFDESYWMYMEDLDLCYRAARAGWLTWYEPSVTVMHVKAGTSGKLRSPRLNYAFHSGMFRFYRTHYAAERNRVANAAVYAGIAAKLAGSVARTEVRRGLARRRPDS